MSMPSPLDLPSPEAALAQHQAEALALDPAAVTYAFNLPIRVKMNEAELVGRLFERHWKPAEGVPLGFESIAFRTPQGTGRRITTLIIAAREAHLRGLVGTKSASLRPVLAEGEALIRQISRNIAFLLDDGEATPEDDALAALAEEHANADAIGEIAEACDDYAGLAERLHDRLRALPHYAPDLPARARAVASALREPVTPDRSQLDLRNRLLALADAETLKVRRSAAYLFADDFPEIAAAFASAYLRRQNRSRTARRDDRTAS